MIDRDLVMATYQDGNGYRKTARIVGCSPTSVRRVIDPEYAERSRVGSRATKRRRTGTCRECGGETRYSGKHGEAVSNLCLRCWRRLEQELRRWTRDTIIAAIQEWAREHGGVPPVAPEWQNASRGSRFPAAGTVYNNPSAPFASWADAIEAAGFPRPVVGWKRKAIA